MAIYEGKAKCLYLENHFYYIDFIMPELFRQYPGNSLERSKQGKMTKKSMKMYFQTGETTKNQRAKVIIQLYLREICSDRTDLHGGTNSSGVFKFPLYICLRLC